MAKGNIDVFLVVFLLGSCSLTSSDKVLISVEDPRRLIRSQDHFVCVNFDWWPNDKYSKNPTAHYPWINASILNVDFENPTLLSSLQALSPVYLRVGGSLADQITYDLSSVDPLSKTNSRRQPQDLFIDNEVVQNITNQENAHLSPILPHLNDAHDDDKTPPSCTEPIANSSMTLGYGEGCIDAARYDALHAFCRKAKCKIIFGLNGLYGRTPAPNTTEMWTGAWNSSQAKELLSYTKEKGLSSTLAGVELGNEIDGAAGINAKLPPQGYALDFVELRSLLRDVWPENDDELRPLLIGPDSSGFNDEWWYPQFLNNMSEALVSDTGVALDVVTWHLYILGSGNNTAVATEILNATYLNKLAPKCISHHNVIESYPDTSNLFDDTLDERRGSDNEKTPQFWLGEGGGAYGSGQDGSTNTFMSSFWYADSLGTLAAQGHDAFCRQALVGGNYALIQINGSKMTPNPDLYTAVMWRHLMSDTVLNVFSNTSIVDYDVDDVVNDVGSSWSLGGNGTQNSLRTYAHCARTQTNDEVLGFTPPPGSVSLVLLNLDEQDRDIELDSFSWNSVLNPISTLGYRQEWHFTSTALSSHDMYLNGEILHLQTDGSLPLPLSPMSILNSSTPLHLEATSIAFVLFPDANAPACI